MSSMIQSYVNMIQKKPVKQEKHSQEYYRTHTKAYRPSGYLIDSNPFSLKEAFQSDIKSLQYFSKGIQGKGNDYSIGKINDVAIKLGSLGIAGIIATGKGSPFRKGMEFIGLACWLGAMSLWSKIAINQPLKHLKGVNLDQEYLTAKKHRKSFYQDPQYICWDMYTDEQINKMGDKLGVPKNIKNRRKAIKNKAKQISIQGNTLAMLTAGIATPVAASLFADKIGKHIYEPLVGKMEIINAEALQPKMQLNIQNLLSDKKAEENIKSLLKSDLSYRDIKEITEIINNTSGDSSIKHSLKETLKKIFSGNNAESISISLNDNINQNIAKVFSDNKKQINTDLLNLIAENSKSFDNKLTQSNISDYISSLEKILTRKHIIDKKHFGEYKETLTELLDSYKDVRLKSVNNTSEQLINLSRLLTTYNSRFYSDFEKKFYKYIWNDESSVNARVWNKMKSGTMKALGFDKNMLKKIANAPSDIATQQILNNYFDELINNPAKFNKTIEDLSKLSSKLLEQNEKYLKFSLNYLDNMQNLLTAYDKHGEFSELISSINSMISSSRKNIISKYMSANNNIFAPLKTIITLKEATGLPKDKYKILQHALFNNQTVDAFINRLDNYQNTIKTSDDYWKLVDKIFAPIPENIKDKLPQQLVKKIDDTSLLMRHLLTAQCDTVNIKYSTTDTSAFLSSLKKFNLDKYLDEFFTVSFSNDAAKNICDTIIYKIKTNTDKLNELKSFLYLSEADIINIKNGNYESIYNAIHGSKNVGNGYINTGRYRFRTLLKFMEETDLCKFGAFNISKSKENIVTKLQGATLKDFIKDGAKDIVAYNGWFKKIGLTFIGLCALTGIAILNMGKKNEFNPDFYQKRSDI